MKYSFHCDYCGYKRVTDGTDIQDLVPHKQASVPRGQPVWDPVSKQAVTPKPLVRLNKFKCPGCGRVMSPRRNPEPGEKNDGKEDFLA